MPIYEYACDACSHRFEELVSRGQEDKLRCPKCKGDRLKRLPSVFGASSSGSSSAGDCSSCPHGGAGPFT